MNQATNDTAAQLTDLAELMEEMQTEGGKRAQSLSEARAAHSKAQQAEQAAAEAVRQAHADLASEQGDRERYIHALVKQLRGVESAEIAHFVRGLDGLISGAEFAGSHGERPSARFSAAIATAREIASRLSAAA